MRKKVFYRQCRLKKDNKDGSTSHQTSYIPEPFCVEGKVLKLKDNEGVWDNGWIVEWASENRTEEVPDTGSTTCSSPSDRRAENCTMNIPKAAKFAIT